MDKGVISFSFVQTVKRSFVLNGKRHTVEYPSLPNGRYKLVPLGQPSESSNEQ